MLASFRLPFRFIVAVAGLALAAAPAHAIDRSDDVAESRAAHATALSTEGEADARPAGRAVGLGVTVFTPGIAAKLFLTRSSGFQVGIGFGGHGTMSVHIDYVVTPVSASSPLGSVGPYVGGGIGLGFFGEPPLVVFGNANGSQVDLDAHGTFGLAWNIGDLPLDVFGELQVGVEVLPRVGLLALSYLGARYYF